jgi:polysaccharide pyruvyl transferase WcaK-like protein
MVIGTRLHMCLLALLSEIPAFNISYERKGKEAYNYLKMNNYSCDYNEESSVAMEKFKTFVSEQLNIRKELSHTVYEKHISAQNNLDFFMNSLNEKSIDRPNKLI